MADFRATWVAHGPAADGTLTLSEAEAQRLGVIVGDFLRVLDTEEIS